MKDPICTELLTDQFDSYNEITFCKLYITYLQPTHNDFRQNQRW